MEYTLFPSIACISFRKHLNINRSFMILCKPSAVNGPPQTFFIKYSTCPILSKSRNSESLDVSGYRTKVMINIIWGNEHLGCSKFALIAIGWAVYRKLRNWNCVIPTTSYHWSSGVLLFTYRRTEIAGTLHHNMQVHSPFMESHCSAHFLNHGLQAVTVFHADGLQALCVQQHVNNRTPEELCTALLNNWLILLFYYLLTCH